MDEIERQLRARDNFNYWKNVVGLPQSFPTLAALSDAELDPERSLYLGYRHEPLVQAVLECVSNARTAVAVATGHGCTTLSRYVFKRSVEDAVRTRTIPVRLSVDNFDADDPDYLESVFATCRGAIVKSLVTAAWQRPLRRSVYAGIIGAEEQTEDALARQRARIASLLGVALPAFGAKGTPTSLLADRDVDWDTVRQVAPRLARSPHDLIFDISHAERIELSLQIDLSSARYKDRLANAYSDGYYDVVRKLASAIKALLEQEAADARASEGYTAPRSMLGLMLFGSDDALDAFSAEWHQEFERIAFPQYGPPDVFAILAYHYPQRVRESGILRTQAMAAIISDALVIQAYDPAKSIEAIVEALETAMVERFDTNWANARIRLE